MGRDFLTVGPRAGDHRVAVRAALSIGIPLLILWSMGRLDLSVYASFGAFAALYGRQDAAGDRIRMQLAAGGTLIAGMLLGTALALVAAPIPLRILAIGAYAALVTVISARARWHPPGALFVTFAAGTTAAIPATVGSLVAALAVGVSATLFALAVTVAFALIGRRSLRRSPDRARGNVSWEAVIVVGLGSVLAGFVALALVGTHWYWAMVAAVAALGGRKLTARVVRGAQRLAGTLLGILIAAGLLALNLPQVAVIVVAIALQSLAELFVGRNYGIAMVFITPLALLMVELAVPAAPALLLQDRVIDTIIGVVVGTSVAVLSAMLLRRRGGAS